jgi:hypothetical protein
VYLEKLKYRVEQDIYSALHTKIVGLWQPNLSLKIRPFKVIDRVYLNCIIINQLWYDLTKPNTALAWPSHHSLLDQHYWILSTNEDIWIRIGLKHSQRNASIAPDSRGTEAATSGAEKSSSQCPTCHPPGQIYILWYWACLVGEIFFGSVTVALFVLFSNLCLIMN